MGGCPCRPMTTIQMMTMSQMVLPFGHAVVVVAGNLAAGQMPVAGCRAVVRPLAYGMPFVVQPVSALLPSPHI